MTKVEKYADFIDQNWDEIVKYIDAQYEKEKESFQDFMLRRLKGYLTLLPDHFELVEEVVANKKQKRKDSTSTVGQNYFAENEVKTVTYRRLVKNGKISFDQTIGEFLCNEYTGEVEKNEFNDDVYYVKYGDHMSKFSADAGCLLFESAVMKYIDDHFHTKISEDDYEKVTKLSEKFNRIFGSCKVSEFFYAENAILFLGIENVKLSEVLECK